MFKLAGFEGEEDVAKAEILNIPLQGFMIAYNKLCCEVPEVQKMPAHKKI